MLSPVLSPDPLIDALVRKEREGARGDNFGRLLADGDGWRALDVICTAGPRDRPFEERHAWASVSLVLAGTFAYRGKRAPALMSSGALMLGRPGQSFECSHPHSAGDRCLSFQFSSELIEDIARDADAPRDALDQDRIPPLRQLAPITARLMKASNDAQTFEEIALDLAGTVLRIDGHAPVATSTRDRMRIADVLHFLDAHRDEDCALSELANLAQLSRYHFLRTFKHVTGVTPHQWILRARLREAARRLSATAQQITEIALDVGFADLSNFIRSFRAEFGVSPRRYRATIA